MSSKNQDQQADALLLFGATGDLAKKKLFPALYHLMREGKLAMPVVGIARSKWNETELRDYARKSIEEYVPGFDPSVVEQLCGQLRYLRGDYSDQKTFESLAELTNHAQLPVSFFGDSSQYVR